MVAPLVGMLVANVASSALSGSKGKDGEKEGGLDLAKLIDPLGIMGGDKDKKKDTNPLEMLASIVGGGGEKGGMFSMMG